MKSKLLISKDVLRQDYLSCYGGRIYETPNIDMLARKGTLFKNFYTAAVSSGMAYSAMFSGLNIHEMKRSYFHDVDQFDQCPTLFQLFEEKGYETHVIWDKRWYKSSRKKAQVFSKNTNFHNLSIEQPVGPHCKYERSENGRIISQQNTTPIEDIMEEVKTVLESKTKQIFLWIHSPHVYVGRTGYGSDIDMFDTLVGELMKIFIGDIYLTGDHGHMNGEKSIPCYGHHVYEGAIKIPLITPNHFGKKIIETPLSNIQLKNIVLEEKFDSKKFVYSDSRYYLQPDRKLAIRKGDFKYIYNKNDKSEELYDLTYDANENVNLLLDKIIDTERLSEYFLDEIFYYPRWKEAEKAYLELKAEKDRIWKNGNQWVELYIRAREIKRRGLLKTISTKFKPKKILKGRWEARAKTDLSKK